MAETDEQRLSLREQLRALDPKRVVEHLQDILSEDQMRQLINLVMYSTVERSQIENSLEPEVDWVEVFKKAKEICILTFQGPLVEFRQDNGNKLIQRKIMDKNDNGDKHYIRRFLDGTKVSDSSYFFDRKSGRDRGIFGKNSGGAYIIDTSLVVVLNSYGLEHLEADRPVDLTIALRFEQSELSEFQRLAEIIKEQFEAAQSELGFNAEQFNIQMTEIIQYIVQAGNGTLGDSYLETWLSRTSARKLLGNGKFIMIDDTSTSKH